MKRVSIKKVLGITAITIAFCVVLVLGIIYVQRSEANRTLEEMGLKESMTEIIDIEPEYDIVTTAGTFRVKLYKKTPEHLKNFDRLVREHFYDSVLFHRVIEGFMIQTGDPLTKDEANADRFGQGGPGYTLPAEFVPEYYHKKGALAAARKGDRANPKKSSSGSQFYIVQDEMNCAHLDGEYTVFGEVIDGLEVIDDIAAFPTDPYDRPVFDVRIRTIKKIEAAPVSTTLDSLRASMDSVSLHKLDSLAEVAGIDSTDVKQLDSLARTLGLNTPEQLEDKLKEVGEEAMDKAKLLGLDEKDLKDMAEKEIKKIDKKDIQELKKMDLDLEKLKKEFK